MWIAYAQRRTAAERPNSVGDEAVFGPIAAADYIAGAAPSRSPVASGRKTILIGGSYQFRTAFTGTVGIVAAEPIILTMSLRRVAIRVTFVTGYDDDGAHRSGLPRCLEHVRGAHHVGRQRLHWIAIGSAHQRLRREVEDYLRLHVRERRS